MEESIKKKFILFLLVLIIISLSNSCEKKDNETRNDVNSIVQEDESQSGIESDNEPYSEYPYYFEELLLTLEKYEIDEDSFVDERDTRLKPYLEIPEDQTLIGYVDNYEKYEEEKIYYIQWLNLGDGKVLTDLSFDLSGFQVENKRWDHRVNYYNEEKDIVYLVFTAFPLWLNDETLSKSGSHRILMLVEFKTNTPKQYSVTVFQTDEHSGSEWFDGTYRIDNTLYQMSDMDQSWSIDLITKELHYCEVECEMANEVASEYIEKYATEGKKAKMHHFYAVMHVDDVVIFRGLVSEDMDSPTLLNIYVAYRGEEYLGYMVIDEETKEVLDTGY